MKWQLSLLKQLQIKDIHSYFDVAGTTHCYLGAYIDDHNIPFYFTMAFLFVPGQFGQGRGRGAQNN